MLQIFGRNFRGFSEIDVDLSKTNFVVGDNSSGKSSLLHLVDCILKTDLNELPRLNEELAGGRYDFFSPYFDDADVTLGYTYKNDDGEAAKFVTLRKSKTGQPLVTRCSYFTSDAAFCLKRRANKLYVRESSSINIFSSSEILNFHDFDKGFKSVKQEERLILLNDPTLLFTLFDRNKLQESGLFQFIFSNALPSSSLNAPVRGLPEKYYALDRKISVLGTHFATMWHDLKQGHKEDALKKINRFGKESKLFEQLNVAKIQTKLADSPLLVSVTKRGKDFSLNQMGVGISQVVPVLVDIMFNQRSKDAHIFCLQQPELHLHPVAQAALGTFIFEMATQQSKFLIETHSSFLIDRYRADYRGSKQKNKESQGQHPNVLFCENTETGNRCHTIEVDKDGKLLGEPDSYHSFFVEEYLKTVF